MRIHLNLIAVTTLCITTVLGDDREAAANTVRATYSTLQKGDWEKLVDLRHPTLLKQFQRDTISNFEASLGFTLEEYLSDYGVSTFDELRTMDARKYNLKSFELSGDILLAQKYSIKVLAVKPSADGYVVEVKETSMNVDGTKPLFKSRVTYTVKKDGKHFKVAAITRPKKSSKDQQE